MCESCKKWCKVPFSKDLEGFVCINNRWDKERASCEAPEESWDSSSGSEQEDTEDTPDITMNEAAFNKLGLFKL